MSLPIVLDVVNALDALGKAVDSERALRETANMAWARGEREGGMIEAHKQSIEGVRQYARALLGV
jgi:hypothetical protein